MRYFIKEVGEPVSIGKATPFPYRFIVVDESGKQIKYFETGRGKTFYMAMIRDDLGYFRHLHPREAPQRGVFTVNLRFPDCGRYRLFADFIPLDAALSDLPHATAIVDFHIKGKGEPKPLGSYDRSQTFGIYEVALETRPDPPSAGPAKFLFHVAVDKKIITDFEDHLGSAGHLMIFRKDSLDYEHAVAKDESGTNTLPELQFSATLPQSGIYKLFMEFRHSDMTTTCEFLLKAGG